MENKELYVAEMSHFDEWEDKNTWATWTSALLEDKDAVMAYLKHNFGYVPNQKVFEHEISHNGCYVHISERDNTYKIHIVAQKVITIKDFESDKS